jgi:hypothetical protein
MPVCGSCPATGAGLCDDEDNGQCQMRVLLQYGLYIVAIDRTVLAYNLPCPCVSLVCIDSPVLVLVVGW